MTLTYSQDLAQKIASLDFEAIPFVVIEKLKTCLLYGLSMSACAAEDQQLLDAVLGSFHSPGSVRTLVYPMALSAPDAAFVGGFRMCARGQNDTFADVIAHPGCIVIPAVISLAQALNSTGQQVLTALAVGYETISAVATGVANDVVSKGFRASSVFGVLGAAAACAKLLGLDAKQTAHALGIATQFAGGTMQCWGEATPEWRLQIGNSARAGLIAAQLAQKAYPAASQSLEGKNGFYRAFSGHVPSETPLWAWRVPEVVFKPLPGCLINQAPLYQLLLLMDEHRFSAQQVVSIQVAMSPRNADYPGIKGYGPFDSPVGAIMSCPFMLAVALVTGTLKTSDFNMHYAHSDFHNLSRCIEVVSIEGLGEWASDIEIKLNDGRLIKDVMLDLTGFAFAWEETDRFLREITGEWPWSDGAVRYELLKSVISQLDKRSSISEIIDLLQPRLV